jgi:3-hydroxy-9,10-secoandrosta-1,3,5(10)-triene-9,17-dione monooxygenase reductase component
MSDGPAGASVRYGNPWAGPPQARDPLRRWRGHLVLPVTIWLAGGTAGEGPTGLTVSSLVVGQGEPPVLAGVISPSTELADAVSTPSARFVVHLVGPVQRRLAQHFAGELPAPPELLATRLSPHGPVLEALADRIFCRVTSSKPFGWSLLVEADVTDVEVGEPGKALAWYHGAFHEVGS